MSDIRPMVERHWHWRFLAYNGEPVIKGNVDWGVSIDVVGYFSEADANVAARDIVQRDQYVLRSVWECASCGYQSECVAVMKQIADHV